MDRGAFRRVAVAHRCELDCRSRKATRERNERLWAVACGLAANAAGPIGRGGEAERLACVIRMVDRGDFRRVAVAHRCELDCRSRKATRERNERLWAVACGLAGNAAGPIGRGGEAGW